MIVYFPLSFSLTSAKNLSSINKISFKVYISTGFTDRLSCLTQKPHFTILSISKRNPYRSVVKNNHLIRIFYSLPRFTIMLFSLIDIKILHMVKDTTTGDLIMFSPKTEEAITNLSKRWRVIPCQSF